MGYFDSFAEVCFKRDAQGRAIYYPAGIWSKGRIVPDAATETAIKTRLKRAYMVMLPVAIIAGAVLFRLSLPLFVGVTVCLMIAFHLYVRSLGAGLPLSEERLTLREAQASQARTLGRGWLIALVIISAIFVAAGAALAILDPARSLWTGLGSAAFFGACLVMFLMQLKRFRGNGA